MMAHKIRRLYAGGKEQGIKVRLEWVKGHSGVKGNEEADKTGKKSTAKGRTYRNNFTPIAYLERESRECTIRDWEEEWVKRRNSEKAVLTPKDRHKVRNEEMKDREVSVILNRVRTGHIDTNAYLYRINKRLSVECECGEGERNMKHIMSKCRFTTSEREKGKEHDSILELLWCKEGLSTAVKITKGFCKRRKEEREVEEVRTNKS